MRAFQVLLGRAAAADQAGLPLVGAPRILGDHPAFRQGRPGLRDLLAAIACLFEPLVGRGSRQLGIGSRQFMDIRLAVDARQQLAGLDGVALVLQHLEQFTRHPESQVHAPDVDVAIDFERRIGAVEFPAQLPGDGANQCQQQPYEEKFFHGMPVFAQKQRTPYHPARRGATAACGPDVD